MGAEMAIDEHSGGDLATSGDRMDDFDLWLESEQDRDARLAGAIEDAACRSSLLTHLIRRRHELGASQVVVANIMETTQSAISELEKGGTDPRLSTLQRYARAVDCAVRVHVAASQPSFVFLRSVSQGSGVVGPWTVSLFGAEMKLKELESVAGTPVAS